MRSLSILALAALAGCVPYAPASSPYGYPYGQPGYAPAGYGYYPPQPAYVAPVGGIILEGGGRGFDGDRRYPPRNDVRAYNRGDARPNRSQGAPQGRPQGPQPQPRQPRPSQGRQGHEPDFNPANPGAHAN